MSKRVYISADYEDGDGDRNVVEELNKWGQDKLHKVGNYFHIKNELGFD